MLIFVYFCKSEIKLWCSSLQDAWTLCLVSLNLRNSISVWQGQRYGRHYFVERVCQLSIVVRSGAPRTGCNQWSWCLAFLLANKACNSFFCIFAINKAFACCLFLVSLNLRNSIRVFQKQSRGFRPRVKAWVSICLFEYTGFSGPNETDNQWFDTPLLSFSRKNREMFHALFKSCFSFILDAEIGRRWRQWLVFSMNRDSRVGKVWRDTRSRCV